MPRGHGLDFITNVFTAKKQGWTPEIAIKLTVCIQKQMKMGSGFKFDSKLASKATGMSGSGCLFFLKELRQAQARGWTIEQYFAKGRPFRYGKKVLA